MTDGLFRVALRGLAVGVAVAAVAGGAAVSAPLVTGSFPVAAAASHATGCAARTVTGRFAMKLVVAGGAQGKFPIVEVCIDDKGPYPFVVSTGAGASVVAPSLARALHLKKGAGTPVRGDTCVASAPSAVVTDWSMAGAKLAAQTVLVARVPRDGMSTAPRGVIGSDVLTRFRAVQIDYRKKRMLVPGGEGPAPKGNTYTLGQTKTALPSDLSAGTLQLSAPLRVFESTQGTIVAAPVKVGGRTVQLAVDTGAASSALVPPIATSLKLKVTGAKSASSGVGCKGTASTYSSGAWSIGGTALGSASLEARTIAGTVNDGLQGVLGSDVLAGDGAVVVDYAGAHLWLTSG